MNARPLSAVALAYALFAVAASATTLIEKFDESGEIVHARIEQGMSVPRRGEFAFKSNYADPDSTLVPLHYSGSGSRCIDIVIYPGLWYPYAYPDSGFTAAADTFAARILAFPQIETNRDLVNIYRLDARSPDDGCSVFGAPGYGTPDGDDRAIVEFISEHYPGFSLDGDDQVVVLFNAVDRFDVLYARVEFDWNMVYNPSWAPHVIVHELGHSLGKLGDEYDASYEQPSDPEYPNIASLTPGYTCEEKWGSLMSLPEVGCYQNAGGTNWYRPTFSGCVMRYSYLLHWCPVCSSAIQAVFDAHALSGVPADEKVTGLGLDLGIAYPNPFNPQTTIAFELGKREAVSLRVFDVSGRLVRVLVGGEVYAPGRHETVWNGRDDAGRQLASGTYFYRLESDGYSETKRMVLVK